VTGGDSHEAGTDRGATSAASVKRLGRLVLCGSTPPDTPSRWCRWFGHPWTTSTSSRGPRITRVYRFCNRCGADESYYPPDSLEARRAVA